MDPELFRREVLVIIYHHVRDADRVDVFIRRILICRVAVVTGII